MRTALCSALLLAATAGAAHAHEPPDIAVEITKFEEYGNAVHELSGSIKHVYRIGMALTNNDNMPHSVSIELIDERGDYMQKINEEYPSLNESDAPVDCTNVYVQGAEHVWARTTLDPEERISLELCFARMEHQDVEPHHVEIGSFGVGRLLATITDQVDEDLCLKEHSEDNHSHCVPAQFTGAASDYTTLALLAAIGVGAAAAAVLLARRRRK